MNKPLKYSLIGIAGLLFLVIAAAVAFVLTFDANRYKPQIERLVLEKTGRTLKLRGPLQATVWPGLGAKVSGVTFSERGSDQQFLALDNAHASIGVMALLQGRVVVDRIRISGFKATIVKQKDGRFNFSDLLEAKPAKEEKSVRKDGGGGTPVAFDVAGIDIDKSAIVYRDLSTGNEYSVSDFKLGTGHIAERADGKLNLHAAVKAPDLDLKLDVGGNYKVDVPAQAFALDGLNLKVSGKEETNLKGRLAKVKSQLEFDLAIDRLNLDALTPEKKPAASASSEKPAGKQEADAPVDLSALKDLNADGKLRIGALQAGGLKLSDMKLEVKAAGGHLRLPHSANLYEGTLTGTLDAHADNRVALKQAMNGIAIGPLLRDAAQQDKLEGKGNLVLDVYTAGKSRNAMKRALGGTAKVELRDGAIKGIDIAATLRRAQSLGRGGAQAAASTEKSDFSEMTASFLIKNGVAHNEDLDVKAPLFRVGGRGDIDIGNSSLDYTTKASLVATAKGQGGAERADVSGITVPVRLSGPFDDMKYDVRYGDVAADVAKSKVGERLRERLDERTGGQGGATVDKLRGLFR